jgi:hypothetical protein
VKQTHSTQMTGEQVARILDTRDRKLARKARTIQFKAIRKVTGQAELRAAEGRWS